MTRADLLQEANATDAEAADPFRSTKRPPKRRGRVATPQEIALDAAAQAEMLAEQLRAIADAAAFPPPEAFAPSLDPDEMPEPPFTPDELADFLDDDDEFAMVHAQAAVPVAPAGTTALLERSSRATRVDFACRPVARPDRELSEALKTLQRLSAKMTRGNFGRRY